MRHSLREGPSLSLAKQVANRVDWTDWRFETYANTGLPEVELVDFSSGGKVSGSVTDQWLLRRLAAYGASADATLIAEDWRADPDDLFLTSRGMPTFFYGNEVYYALKVDAIEDQPQWRLVLSNTVPTFHAFILRGDHRPEIGSRITAASILEMVQSVRGVICGAYDGEGYVVGLAPDSVA
jgi:hypothetical protein